MTSVDSNFKCLCGRPHGDGPPSPSMHMRPPEPDPLPLRVDVINGWPLIYSCQLSSFELIKVTSATISKMTISNSNYIGLIVSVELVSCPGFNWTLVTPLVLCLIIV